MASWSRRAAIAAPWSSDELPKDEDGEDEEPDDEVSEDEVRTVAVTGAVLGLPSRRVQQTRDQ